MMLFLLLFSCSETEAPSSLNHSDIKIHHPKRQKIHRPPPKGNRVRAESLSSSWREELALSNPVFQQNAVCPDDDGDGFFDAKTCGNQLPIEQVDCDDADSSVTPKTERYIASGYFLMGSASTQAGFDENPVEAVWLDGFCLDVSEINNRDFHSWSLLNGITTEHLQDFDPEKRPNLPVEGLSWSEANAYCAATKKTLPTEAQWEKAARGGCEFGSDTDKCDPLDLRSYPWGNQPPDCQKANHQSTMTGRPTICLADTVESDALPQGDGPYGHHHLAGNVWEFVSDYWHPDVYRAGRRNPAGPKKGRFHVLKGGSWNTFSTNMRVSNRFHDLVMGSATGFRCARSFVPQIFDDVSPVLTATIRGTITHPQKIEGKALYITAFSALDVDSNQRPLPGRSPISEIRLPPNGKKSQSFSIDVPKNGKYFLSASLDIGSMIEKSRFQPPSASGGIGQAKQNPLVIKADLSGISIQLLEQALE